MTKRHYEVLSTEVCQILGEILLLNRPNLLVGLCGQTSQNNRLVELFFFNDLIEGAILHAKLINLLVNLSVIQTMPFIVEVVIFCGGSLRIASFQVSLGTFKDRSWLRFKDLKHGSSNIKD